MKIEINSGLAASTSLKELRGFLGFINRYFTYFPHMALVTAPLARATLLKNFTWTKDMQTAFEITKQKLANVNTLTIIQLKGELILETDSSGIGISAVLLRIQNGTEKPNAYYSKTLNNAERNYDVCKREMFALVKAVKYFSLYLPGSTFAVRTDNAALRWREIRKLIRKAQLLGGKQYWIRTILRLCIYQASRML
jgi:hypothetical protein